MFGLTEWLDRRRAFRELGAPVTGPGADYSLYIYEQIGAARDALAAGNRNEALAICNRVRAQFPQQATTTKAGLRLFLDLGFFDEAETMMQEARRRYPRFADFAVGYAEVAYRRGNLAEALTRLETVRRKFPRAVEGYTIAAICLRRLERLPEVEAMIQQAVRKFPDVLEVLIEHARHAEQLGDWEVALRRWEVARKRSDTADIRIYSAACLRLTGRYAEAEEAAKDICSRFPRDWRAHVELAKIAMAEGEFDEAARRWETVRTRNPFLSIAYTAGADSARRAGREAEADEILMSWETRRGNPN